MNLPLSRILKPLKQAIEMERRFSKTLPRLDLDPILIDRILAMAVICEAAEGMKLDIPLAAWLICYLQFSQETS